MYFYLHDILEKAKIQESKTEEWLPKVGSRERTKFQRNFLWMMKVFYNSVVAMVM